MNKPNITKVSHKRPEYDFDFSRDPKPEDLQLLFDTWGIRYFTAKEVLEVGNPNLYDGPEYPVPRWKHLNNIYSTIQLADHIRDMWGGPVIVGSGYRPPAYNEVIDGADRSRHITFQALDLEPKNGNCQSFVQMVEYTVTTLRNFTTLDIGLGRYDWGVHIDVVHKRHKDEQRDWFGWDGS